MVARIWLGMDIVQANDDAGRTLGEVQRRFVSSIAQQRRYRNEPGANRSAARNFAPLSGAGRPAAS